MLCLDKILDIRKILDQMKKKSKVAAVTFEAKFFMTCIRIIIILLTNELLSLN